MDGVDGWLFRKSGMNNQSHYWRRLEQKVEEIGAEGENIFGVKLEAKTEARGKIREFVHKENGVGAKC
jgi:hypothetical protein